MTDFSESTFQSKMELRNISHAFQTTSQYIAIINKLFFWVNGTKNMFTFFHNNFGNTWIASGKLIKIWFLVVKQTGYETKETPQLRQLNVDMPSCSVWYLQVLKLVKRIFKNLLSPCTVCKSTLGHKICTGCIMVSSFTCSVFVK